MREMSKWKSPERYVAFICYSRKDENFAGKVHKGLEACVVPPSSQLALPISSSKKFRPIYRDIEEFSASADLGGSIRLALSKSDALIVIVSRNSCASRWVNEEIREFSSQKPGRPIIGVRLAEDRDELDAVAQEKVTALVNLNQMRPSNTELSEIIALAMRRETTTFCKERRSYLRKRLAGRASYFLGTVMVILCSAALSIMIAVGFGIFSAFSRSQDSYVLSAGCRQVERVVPSAEILLNPGAGEWLLASSNVRMVLTKMYDSCRSAGRSKLPEPAWIVRR